MRKIAAPLAVSLGLLGASAPAAAAPETAPPEIVNVQQLTYVYEVARALGDSTQCTPTPAGEPASETNQKAARAHAQAAAMLDAAARHYPANDGKTDPAVYRQRLSTLIQHALRSYELAYTCIPGFERRHHIESALALVAERTRQIREDEKRPPTDQDYQELALRQNELFRLMPTPPPAPAPLDTEEPGPAQPTTSEPPTGYARYAGFFVLRPELGFGFGRMRAASPDDVRGDDAFRGVYFNVYAAARFTLGERRVHALSVGGLYNIQQVAREPIFDGKDAARSISAAGVRLEFALHAHPRWVSFHPAVELGVQVYLGAEKFGRPYMGPGLGLCFDRELVCINAKGSLSATSPHADGIIQVVQIGLALDIMRIVDARVSSTHDPGGPSSRRSASRLGRAKWHDTIEVAH